MICELQSSFVSNIANIARSIRCVIFNGNLKQPDTKASGPDRFEQEVDLSLSNLNRGRLGRHSRGGQPLVHRPMRKSSKASFRAGLVRCIGGVQRSDGNDMIFGSGQRPRQCVGISYT